MNNLPKVTFGTIVLNGEPFIRYNLRALYPFAHQIIVVEGAASAVAGITTADGHSTDTTLETLCDFKAREDPEHKLVIVTAEDEGHADGFWKGEKDEQSQAYAKRATGDYLWQVDIDEFYQPEDMHTVLEMLRRDPDITAVSFRIITFWGDLNLVTDGWYMQNGAEIYHRLFKWGSGYKYVTHRPPTVLDSLGRDLRTLKWIGGYDLWKRGIQLYHYSLLFPKQVSEKALYYAAGPWGEYSKGIVQWADENYLSPVKRPFQFHNVHSYTSWISRFSGQQPPQVQAMWKDVRSGEWKLTCRDNSDVESLLSLSSYRIGKWLVEKLSPFAGSRFFMQHRFSKFLFRIRYDYQQNRLFWQ